jgi:hypothetical protein
MDRPRTLLASAWVIAGLLVGGSLARATSTVGHAKTRAPVVEVEAKLLEYEERHPWCTYPLGEAVHGMGESPWARFKITKPTVLDGRAFGVLFKCGERKDLLRALRSGTGRVFVLVLPEDFLQGKYSEIEDCSIDSTALNRWRSASAASEAR